MSKKIMVVGTASSVGKSLIATGLCRVFTQDGFKVAPFKSQNMSLNSYVTKDGAEIGRSQAVQAWAAETEPLVEFNPILLKPSGNNSSQIVLNGKVFKGVEPHRYREYKPWLKGEIMKSFSKLEAEFDLVVMEGAGSCAEINLNEDDIVNLGMAEMGDAPVILVSDIERGGVFGSIYGTLALLSEKERERVKGVVINKFRGDISLFRSGREQLESLINLPVLGVIPYINLQIDDEDGATNYFDNDTLSQERVIDIVIIKTPYISNFTDFDILKLSPELNIRFIKDPKDFGNPDLVILPGSKATLYDLNFLKTTNLDQKIVDAANSGKMIIGICGGFQILGNQIDDQSMEETSIRSSKGLALLNLSTDIMGDKHTSQVKHSISSNESYFKNINGQFLEGYEIHMGVTEGEDEIYSFTDCSSGLNSVKKGNIIGTYIHGIFDNISFSELLFNDILRSKGISDRKIEFKSLKDSREHSFNRLATHLRNYMDMDKIYEIMG
jgi:adenosylcobyric acid synthase